MKTYYVGTYLSDGGEGIYQFTFDQDRGDFSQVKLFCTAKNSKYILCENDKIFSLFDGQNSSGVAVYSKDGQLIDSIEFEETTSCYIIKQKEYIYTANYYEGSVTKLQFKDGKLTVIAQKIVQQKAGAHQVIPFGEKLLVPCLLLDRIYILDRELNIIEFIELAPKSGPRHGVISKDNKYLYLVGELSDKLYTFSIQKDTLKLIDEISLLPEGVSPVSSTAAIRMSNDGNTLMISTREINTITMLDISKELPKVIESSSSMGDHPRDILNVLDDKYLMVANRTSGTVVSFELNGNKINKKCSEISICGAVSICLMEE